MPANASLGGAGPGKAETEVDSKKENGIAALQGLKHITTKVQDGGVTLTNEFRLEKPVQEALDEVRSAVQDWMFLTKSPRRLINSRP